MLPTIIVPAPQEEPQKEVERKNAEARSHWLRQYRDLTDPLKLPRNTRFWHDPEWRERLMSITKAGAMDHPLWLGVAALFALGVAAFLTMWIITFRGGLPL